MARIIMIREPEVEQRAHGVRRWSVAWGLFDRSTLHSSTQRRLFFTRRAAERWIARKRVGPEDAWTTAPQAAPKGGASE